MRNALKSDSGHVTPSSGNVFEDLGFPPEKALALKFRAKVLAGILEEIQRKKYRQKQLVELLDDPDNGYLPEEAPQCAEAEPVPPAGLPAELQVRQAQQRAPEPWNRRASKTRTH